METYIAILLLIAPGFIAQQVYETLNREKKKHSNLEETVMALVFSVFILIIVFPVMALISGKWDILIIKTEFNTIWFTIVYSIIALIISILLGYIWNIIKPILFKLINRFRYKNHKNGICDSECVWDLMFDDGKQHAVCIEKDGKEYAKGFIKKISHAANSNDIYLERGDLIEKNPSLFNNIKGTYLDFNNNVKITEYDLSQIYLKKEGK